MLTRNSRRALSERTENEGSPAKRRKLDQGSKSNIEKSEMPECTERKRKVKPSQNTENCNPGPSTSRSRILHRHTRQALVERVNNKGPAEEKVKVERASRKNIVKNENSEPLKNEINTNNSPPKRQKVTRSARNIVMKKEASENIDNTIDIKISPSVNSLNKSTSRSSGVKKETLAHSLSRPESEEDSMKENIDDKISKKVKKGKSKKVGVKKELTKPNLHEIDEEYSNNVENFIQGPSTSTNKDIDVKKEILPNRTKLEDNNLIENETLVNQEETIADKNDSIVELEVPQKVFEEVLLSDDEDEQIGTSNTVATPVDQSGETNLILPRSGETEVNPIGNEVSLNQNEAIGNNDDSIVEVEVPQKIVEEVLLSDGEDEEMEARKRMTDRVDKSVNSSSGSNASTSQNSSSRPHKRSIEIIKIEDPSPQSSITPKKKKLVLDPAVLTPPTGSLQENAAKLWKCMQFLEQSDLNPEAKEFVPSPKVSKKIVDEPKPTDCIVCLEPRETTFVNLPCRHAVTCGPCSDQLELLGKDCPVCRAPIESRFQIYN